MTKVVPEVRKVISHLVDNDLSARDISKKYREIKKVEKLPGDASARKYFRILTNRRISYILMKVDPFSNDLNRYDFVMVQKHLRASGVDVPEIYDVNASVGFLLLEDLGDETLLRRLQSVSDVKVERVLYEKVIDSLVSLHFFASKKGKTKNVRAFKLLFDHKKLMWEINFTIEHFYLKHLDRSIKSKDLKILKDGFSKICRKLSNQTRVFTHRDFHSRNVMIKNQRFVMIDFQDARMGPPQYDLASVLKDSYYQLEESQVEKLVDYYISQWKALSGKKIDREKFIEIFDIMSVQRNFKAIGSFASFLNRRGNPTYLKYIGNTFENMRRALLKYPEYSKLREVLFHYYYF